MLQLSPISIFHNCFTVPERGESSLWQLDRISDTPQLQQATLEHRGEIDNTATAPTQLRSLLPFIHCGKITVVTPSDSLFS